jgi:hypothetical protein
MEKIKVYEAKIDEEGELGVYAISFVDEPAIQSGFMHFKNQYKLRKIDEDKRMVYGPAMIPDLPIYRVDEKGNEFFIKFPKDVVREMAHRFLMKNNHQNTTVDHEKKLSNTIVVESWLKEGESDKSISLGLGELPDGTWLTGSKVNDDDVWMRVKSGELTGYSIEVDLDRVLVGADPVDELVKEMEQIINSI